MALYPASSKADKTQFHQINKRPATGCASRWSTRRPAASSTKGKGSRLRADKGKYVPIEPEEIEAIEFENTHTIDIDNFVPEEEIDKRYYERPYYIVPNDESGEEAYAVIRDAWDKDRVALGGIVFANREHVMAVEPWGKGMLGTTLRYDYEVRDEKELFRGIRSRRVPKEMVSLASHILDTKAGHFDPSKFKDEYEMALRVVKRKANGKPIEPPEEKEDPSNVIDLMEALRQSVKGKGRKVAALRTNSDSKKTQKAGRGASARLPDNAPSRAWADSAHRA